MKRGAAERLCHSFLRALGVLVDELLVDVGDDTATCNSSLDKLVQLFITTDSKLQMAGSDALHLQVF